VVVNYVGEAIYTEGLMAVLADENDIRCEIYLSEIELMSISFDCLKLSSQMLKSSQGDSGKFSLDGGTQHVKERPSGGVEVTHPKFQDTIPGQVGPKLSLAYNCIRNGRGTPKCSCMLFDVRELFSYLAHFMTNDYIHWLRLLPHSLHYY
jgi:hypothetical protein